VNKVDPDGREPVKTTFKNGSYKIEDKAKGRVSFYDENNVEFYYQSPSRSWSLNTLPDGSVVRNTTKYGSSWIPIHYFSDDTHTTELVSGPTKATPGFDILPAFSLGRADQLREDFAAIQSTLELPVAAIMQANPLYAPFAFKEAITGESSLVAGKTLSDGERFMSGIAAAMVFVPIVKGAVSVGNEFRIGASTAEEVVQATENTIARGPHSLPLAPESQGTFQLTASFENVPPSMWADFPAGVPRPTGPISLLEGDAYATARQAAYKANRPFSRGLGLGPAGYDIHEIIPVKFNGSPTAVSNKVGIFRPIHRQVTAWFEQLQRLIEGK